jgi:ferredoxin
MTEAATIILSRHAGHDPERQRFEDDVVGELTRMDVRLVVTPHVYYLTSSSAAAARLHDAAGAGSVVAAWLYPRAIRWILATHGLRVAPDHIFDLREFRSPHEAAVRLAASIPAVPGRADIEDLEAAQTPRWYPVIDHDRCTGCRQCLDFCLFGVYSVDGSDDVVPTQPDNCKPGCPACARVCPVGAIMFPEYDASATIAGGDGPAEEAPTSAASAGVSPASPPATQPTGGERDELDDLIDALDDLDKD